MSRGGKLDNWRRREKVRRTFDLRGLPAQLNVGDLDDPELDGQPALKRALTEMYRGAQQNFDHLHAETTRFAKLFNENEADTYAAKDELFDHYHPSASPHMDVARADDIAATDAIYQPFAGGNAFPDMYWLDLEAIPFWCGSNFHGDSISAELNAYYTGFGTTGTWKLHMGVYAGDGPGNLPYSLVEYAGVSSNITNGSPAAGSTISLDLAVDFREGEWYWLAGWLEEVSAGDLLIYFDGYNTTEALTSAASPISFWSPLPKLTGSVDDYYQTVSYDIHLAHPGGSAAPFVDLTSPGAIIRQNFGGILQIGVS